MPFAIKLKFQGTETLKPVGRDLALLRSGGQAYQEYADALALAEDEDVLDDSPEPDVNGHQGTGERNLSPSTQTDAGTHVTTRRQAAPRPIKADYDSLDGRIFELKQAGRTDNYISDRIFEEFGLRYQPNTITARHSRVRAKVAQQEEDRLDDELTDWHEEEDDALKDCFKETDDKIRAEIKKLEDKRWAEVAAKLEEKLAKKKFSAKACHERSEGLKNGTALVAIELDPDQEGRKVLRENRIAEAKARRAEEIAKQQAADEAKGAKKKGKKGDRDELNRRKIRETSRREQQAREKERLNKLKHDQREEAERLKDEYQARKTAQAEWNKQVKAAEDEIVRNARRDLKEAGRVARLERKRQASKKTKCQGLMLNYYNEEDEDDEEVDVKYPMVDSKEDLAQSKAKPATASTGTSGGQRMKCAADENLTSTGHDAAPDTRPNPRSVLTLAELEAILFERGLPRRLPEETQPQLVARLAYIDSTCTFTELGNLLKAKFENVQGTKADRIKRLQEADASSSEAGEQGIKAKND